MNDQSYLVIQIKVFVGLACTLLFLFDCVAETPIEGSACAQSRCGLSITSESGDSTSAPILATAVNMTVSGVAIRTLVKQSFTNPTNDWVEGIYSYPLPEGAAVNELRMRIGDREVLGEIHERERAEKKYTAAKITGRKASIVNAHRPNLFTTKVANLGPRERVDIEIAYFSELALSNARQEIRFPMVVGPRYSPVQRHDISRITPEANVANDNPYIPTHAHDDPSHNPLSLEINLNIGVPMATINSLYHEINVTQATPTTYNIQLVDNTVPANRDFVLEFTPTVSDTPRTAFLTESTNDYHYGLIMLMPPATGLINNLPREVTFILDRSGSMGGTSIVQAKAALLRAFDDLRADDQFNLIVFNDTSHALFEDVVDASAVNLQLAKQYLARLRANGGTEMLASLKLALDKPTANSRVQQVIFITDGNVSNESELFTFIESRLGNRRLFTIGIGSAPNQHFLQHAAAVGGGLHTFIGAQDEVHERMAVLFKKLKQPMLSDITISAISPQTDNQSAIEYWPQTLPDLYADEPLAVAFRTRRMPVDISLSGKLPDRHWHTSATLAGGQLRRGISELWGQRKITSLMNDYRRHQFDQARQNTYRQEVIDTALQHHLVSKFTSLVAVERIRSNPTNEANNTRTVARNLPHGWRGFSANSKLPQTATSAKKRILVGLGFILALLLFRQYSARKNGLL